MTIEDEIRAAHERELEELRRDIGTLRHERKVIRGELDIAFADVDDLSRKLAATENELRTVKSDLGHALAQIATLRNPR